MAPVSASRGARSVEGDHLRAAAVRSFAELRREVERRGVDLAGRRGAVAAAAIVVADVSDAGLARWV